MIDWLAGWPAGCSSGVVVLFGFVEGVMNVFVHVSE